MRNCYGWSACVAILLGLAAPGWAGELVFHRGKHKLELLDAKGKSVGSWEAYNNVVRDAKPYPTGTWKFSHHAKHADDAPNSAFGSHGNLVFDMPGRTGMGVHSGRASASRDPGPKHPTHGCIRTTDAAIKAIVAHHAKDSIKQLRVED